MSRLDYVMDSNGEIAVRGNSVNRQDDGKLSAAKRKFFPELSEDEIQRLEAVVNA